MTSMRRSVIVLVLVCAVVCATRFRCSAPHSSQSLSWMLAQLAGALELRAASGNGKMPPNIQTLADEGLLNPESAQVLTSRVKYQCGDKPRSSLSDRNVVAIENPRETDKEVLVLSMDGTVTSVQRADAYKLLSSNGHAIEVTRGSDGR